MLGVGTDKSNAALEWETSEILLNYSMTRKVQGDLESVVGLERKVEESDLPTTMYIMLEYRYNYMV